MSYSAALDSAHGRVRPAADAERDDHPRPLAQAGAGGARGDGIKGNYVRATIRSPLLNPSSVRRAEEHAVARGLPLARHLQPAQAGEAGPADQGPAGNASSRSSRQVNLRYAAVQEPDGLRRAEDRLADQRGGDAAQDLPKAASVIYNRLRLGWTSGSTRRSPTRPATTARSLRSDLHSSSPWNTTNHLGLPPTPIDSPDLAGDQRRRAPGAHRLPVLHQQGLRQRRAALHRRATSSSCVGPTTGTRRSPRRPRTTVTPSSAEADDEVDRCSCRREAGKP